MKDIDIHAHLAKYKQIAIVWSIDDVKENRPDLDDAQAWQVLQAVKRNHDATIGITCETLEVAAETLFPTPETVEP